LRKQSEGGNDVNDLQAAGYIPTKAMVVEFPEDGAFYEGDTYQELVTRMAEARGIDYQEAEDETRWHIRADFAEKWTFSASILGMELSEQIDPDTDETLIISAARGGRFILYDNQAAQ
jgi:hypothetical protein